MTRIAYIQCAAGVAGDMLLGALVDAGADRHEVASSLAGLGVDGYALTFERVQRCGIAATWANVVVHDADTDPDADHVHSHDHVHHDHHPHRPAKVIRELLTQADLPEPVRRMALDVFAVLAEAEGAVHGIDPDAVEFHEVGSLDAIVDVVGVAAALHSLAVERVVAGPIGCGHGTIHAAHGDLPNPPPAVARLLASRGIPVIGVDTGMELATPTGVAILAALAESFGPLVAMTPSAVGYGAGTADPAGRPNVVQVIVGEAVDDDVRLPQPGRAATQLDVNVDDISGEVLAHAISAALGAGAFDAWVTPIVMKKGRPAHTVSALCDPADVERVGQILLAETGSLGIRAHAVDRWPQVRSESTVEVDGHTIAVKLAAGRIKVEHDDAVAAATATGRPLREILAAAEAAARAR
jgi:pyridinium-3,5-bisthiocarboxylic acid mononucleotide nickel chelatase